MTDTANQSPDQSSQAKPPAPDGKTSNKKVLIIIGVVIGALILLSIAGTIASGYIGKKLFEGGIKAATGGQVKVNTSKGEVNIEADGGSTSHSVSDDAKLPDDYPPFVPDAYKGAKLISSSRTVISDSSRFSAVYEVPGASLDDAFSYYKSELTKRGFKIASEMQSGEIASLTAGESDDDAKRQRSFMISFEHEGGKPLTIIVGTSITVDED